jgi:hypothetical protein
LFSGLLLEQSASLPGSTPASSALFFRVRSRAFRAASRARAALIAFSITARATPGFSSRNSESFSLTTLSTAPLTSLLPSLVLVCPSNCGSRIFTEITAVRPSRTSSPESPSMPPFLKSPALRA